MKCSSEYTCTCLAGIGELFRALLHLGANMQQHVNFVYKGLTFSVDMSAESIIGHHVHEGWVAMVFPVRGYVLCIGGEW